MHYGIYPDSRWKIRLTTDRPFTSNDYYGKEINNLASADLIQLRIVTNGGSLWEQSVKGIGMLWRLIPAWEAENDFVFCRDLDSILTPRQAKCVYHFIDSPYIAHGINDNNSHTIPLMGGMVGFRCQPFVNAIGFRSFSSMVDSWGRNSEAWNSHGKDQEFLMDRIWPRVMHCSLIHKIQGPNDRCMLKDPVPGVQLRGLSERLLNEGDNFTNYIGASNCVNTTYGERSLQEMIAFYEDAGNKEKNKEISIAEKS